MKPNNISRSFIPGDDWIYFKFYCGAKTADKVLLDAIKPITDLLLIKKQLDKWFFIRYADTDLHLRLRLHYTNKDYMGNIIQTVHALIKSFVEYNLVWKVQIDTYNREIERYGNMTMELSEDLFYYDSNLFLNSLPYFNKPGGDVQRWLFALKLIDVLLTSFNFSMGNKLDLLGVLKESFFQEFGMNKFLKSQLDTKFRIERRIVERTLISSINIESPIAGLLFYIDEYATFINPLATKINLIMNNNQLDVSLNSLMASFIHMSMNRIFSSRQRIHEMVLYDFLHRYYKSIIARQNMLDTPINVTVN